MSYQPPPSQGHPPQGYHLQGNVQNTYANQYIPFQSYRGYNHDRSPQCVYQNAGFHEGYQSAVRNPQSYSNHHGSYWPTPIGPPPNRYSSSDTSSHPPVSSPPHINMNADAVFVDEDFLREGDELIHGFKPSITPIPFTNMHPPNYAVPRGPPIAASHHPHVHNPALETILVPENLLREADELINGFKPTMTPIPTYNPRLEHTRGGGIENTPPIDASSIQEVGRLLGNFELEPRQGRRPSWGPHKTRQGVRGETPTIAVDRDDLDEMDALIRNFDPEPILPQIPVGRKSSWVVEGRRRRSSTVSSAGADFSPSTNHVIGPGDDAQQSPVSQKRKARFAYMTESWVPKRSQKRRPSNADSPLRISKGLLESSGCDWSRLKPGRLHILVGNPVFMNKGSTRFSKKGPIREESVKYLPRSEEFSGRSHAYHLILSVWGMPGPYIMDLAEENLVIDGHDDDIFSELGNRETKFKIDWPGLSLTSEGFKILKSDGQRQRRGDFATAVATRIAQFIIDIQRFGKPPPKPQVIDANTKDWDLKKVDVTKIRLVSLNYFVSVKAWIPVLAMDSSGKEAK